MRLVFLPPDLADPVRRRNGNPPEPEPEPDWIDLGPEPELERRPGIFSTVTELLGTSAIGLALLGIVGLGIWKLVELVERLARGL